MADHSIIPRVLINGTYTSVASEVKEGSIKYSRGFTQYGDIRPSSISWTFEDPTDKWRPGNPMSPVYGQAGRGVPARVTADGIIRCMGMIESFEPDQTSDFTVGPPVKGRRWVDVEISGILAQIASWTTPLRSSMYRQTIQLANLRGYWPGEDGRQATQLTNAYPNGLPGTAVGISFEEDDAPGGSASAFSFINADSTSKVFGTFPSMSTTAGWQFSWSLKLPALPSGGPLQMISWRTSNGYRWAINLKTGVYNIKIDDASGTNLVDSDINFVGFDPPSSWVTFRMKATVSGGTVTWEFAWYREGAGSNWGSSGTFSGTVGALSSWTANGNAFMQDALMNHVFGATTGTDDLLSGDALAAFVGHVGELAGARFARLMNEEGISWSIQGLYSDTLPMGRQAPETLTKLLQEIADTDQCLIYDQQAGLGVEIRTRANMYNQTPVTFTYPTDIAPPFTEKYDYVGVANVVTATQRDGGEATRSLDSGPMSTQNAPAGIGERKQGIDVNVSDESYLETIASWGLANGTIPGARYPQVNIDLDAFPALTATVNSIKLGDRIVISGRGPDPIDLMVIGIEEAPSQKRRVVTFNCMPGQIFAQIATYDDTTKRYDVASSTLKAGVSSSATALTFTTTDLNEYWSSSNLPYDVMISGERIRVTAMGAPSLVSGAYDQAATVTRSINGVVKSLSAGESVHIATPGRYAL